MGLEASGFQLLQKEKILLFSKTSRPALGPAQPFIQWVAALFPEDKTAGAWS
jgi:hypothetical protein